MEHDSAEQLEAEITCREVVGWTSAYIDQHLDDAMNVRMALHLAACAGCEAYVRQIASVRDLLPLLPRAPSPQRDRLRHAFTAGRQRSPAAP